MGTGMVAVLLREIQSYEVVDEGEFVKLWVQDGRKEERDIESRGKMMEGSGQLRAGFRLYVMVASLDDTADCI